MYITQYLFMLRGGRNQMGRNTKERRYLPLTVLVREEEGQFCSWCPELDISSCGSTIDEASANLKEAVSVFQEKGLKLKSESDESQYGTFMSTWQAPIEVLA
jgi:predicted RNase H-like HicB family nuclease